MRNHVFENEMIPTHLQFSMFKSLIRIRVTEEMIAERYKDQEMRTAVHLGTGQEATAVAVCANLEDGDAVFSHHRAHNHFLASGGSIFSLVAEIYGGEMGCSRGRGGSVHLTHSNKVFFASNAILGESTSLAVGSALSFKMNKKKNIGVSFFGDAAWEEGVIYESLNFAAIHSLPVLFVCENNMYSTESPLKVRKKENSEFTQRAEAFGVRSLKLDGNDLVKLHLVISQLIVEMRSSSSPVLIECETYRWREHVGPNFDHDLGRTYRDTSELISWQAKDPILRMREFMVSKGLSTPKEMDEIVENIENEVQEAFNSAQSSPKPRIDTLMDNSGEI